MVKVIQAGRDVPLGVPSSYLTSDAENEPVVGQFAPET